MDRLHTLIERALEHHRQFEREEYIVTPSLPIVYFGDSQAYLNSTIKIITVGLNPSNREFRLKKNDNYSFCRFPTWEKNKYLKNALDDYFENDPLADWFDKSYEPILEGLEASFYSEKKRVYRLCYANVASNTETQLCSPF